MTTKSLPPKSSRRFSKNMLIFNVLIAWGVVIFAIFWDQVEHVMGPVAALITMMFGLYAGVGHLDFRKAIQMKLEEEAEK